MTDMVEVFTTAPQSYDYSYCETVRTENRELYPGCEIAGRVVRMPAASADYQCGRYSSCFSNVVIR